MTPYENLIEQSIRCIDENNLTDADLFLRKALAEDISSPEVHNLYGIISEYRGNMSLAAKHYRASNALDPSYLPALNNLNRVTTLYFNRSDRRADLGAEKGKELPVYFDLIFDEQSRKRIQKRK